jgi:hypothetical protein
LKLNDSSRYLQQDQLYHSFSIQSLLTSPKKKIEDVLKSIQEMTKFLTIEDLNQILNFLTSENLDIFCQPKNEIDKFFCDIASIPFIHLRIKIMILCQSFKAKKNEYESKISLMKDALKQINQSDKFKFLLNLIVQIGNLLNGGASFGGTYGFYFSDLKFISLPIIAFISKIIKSNRDLAGWEKEISKFLECKSIKEIEISEWIHQNDSILTEAFGKMLEFQENVSNGDQFYSTMLEICDTIKQDFDVMKKEFVNVQSEILSTLCQEGTVQQLATNLSEFNESLKLKNSLLSFSF